MGEKKFELLYLTPDTLKDVGIPWSRKTLERRIADEGFPAIKDGASWLIPIDKMQLWLKRREVQGK